MANASLLLTRLKKTLRPPLPCVRGLQFTDSLFGPFFSSSLGPTRIEHCFFGNINSGVEMWCIRAHCFLGGKEVLIKFVAQAILAYSYVVLHATERISRLFGGCLGSALSKIWRSPGWDRGPSALGLVKLHLFGAWTGCQKKASPASSQLSTASSVDRPHVGNLGYSKAS